MVGAAKRLGLLTSVFLGACGGPTPDFTVHGVAVLVRSDAEFTKQPDFPSRVETTLGAALTYWGGSWEDLAGSTVSFEGARNVKCGNMASAVGCYDGVIRVSTRDYGFTFYCVEETALVHEVGHAVIGDSGHTDPRWLDFETVAHSLAGRPGYQNRGEIPCEIFVSVWRHPPDRSGGT